MLTRICVKCKIEKPLTKFHVSKIEKHGRVYTCKNCISQRGKEYWGKIKNNPEIKNKNRLRTKKYNLKAVYNITLEDYNELVEKQNGLCAICGKVETTSNQFGSRPLCVDHNHETGIVRGLLCAQCNHLLGNAKDNIEILQKAIIYMLG